MRKLIVGNWKMNGVRADLVEIDQINASLHDRSAVEVAICLPFTLLAAAADRARWLSIGGQDCHQSRHGAFTGSVSAEMLKDAGATMVVLGHSERRSLLRESCEDVAAKVTAAQHTELTAVVCVGESSLQRDSGDAIRAVARQLAASLPAGVRADRLVVAYEPVWAIGTGRIPQAADVRTMHSELRSWLTTNIDGGDSVRLLYGGSVNDRTAAELLCLDEADGVLIGGASMRSDEFIPIVDIAWRACRS